MPNKNKLEDQTRDQSICCEKVFLFFLFLSCKLVDISTNNKFFCFAISLNDKIRA